MDLSESLRVGLRQADDQPRNSLQPELLKGCEVTQSGLRYFKQVQDAIASAELTANSVTKDHPFPQIFRNAGVTLLADATKVFTVDEAWELAQLTTYDLYTPANTKGITSGGPWHFVDVGLGWMLLNGACQVFKSTAVEANKTFVQDTVTIKTGCGWRGRVFLAGFDPTDFWLSSWSTEWASVASKWLTEYALSAPGKNWVWWSNIGGGNTTNLFLPTLAQTGVFSGAHGSDKKLYLEQAMMLQSGMMPMPWPGEVLCVKPVRTGVVVYTENGVALLRHLGNEIAPTFGLTELLDFGIASRGAVGGNLDEHLFVDNAGRAWAINGEGQVKFLGYEEYLSEMVEQNMTVVYDPREGYYYISGHDGDSTDLAYLYGPNGLSRVNQRVTSGFNAEGAFVGIGEAIADNNFLYKSEVFDGGSRQVKTLKYVTVGGSNLQGTSAKVYYRNDGYSSFSSKTVALDSRGMALMEISGVEFQVELSDTDYSNIEVDSLNIEFAQDTTLGLS